MSPEQPGPITKKHRNQQLPDYGACKGNKDKEKTNRGILTIGNDIGKMGMI